MTNSASNLSQQSGQLSAALDRFETDVEDAELDPDAELEAPQTELDLGEQPLDAADDGNEESIGVTFDEDEAGSDVVFDDDETGSDVVFDDETAFEPADESTGFGEPLDPVGAESSDSGTAEQSDPLATDAGQSDPLGPVGGAETTDDSSDDGDTDGDEGVDRDRDDEDENENEDEDENENEASTDDVFTFGNTSDDE
ncbi:methyl-accepting chemotaxis sensory transducer [Natrialba magadii ATCC 43099]|uniref:Methyl-accepting chemotaxis sensory transducer n=1 Tax=Natrialba magadii (strain ATCC 43099 / DSM 3394 / CCM 3739 / CIP 104546 / IAM 13178 / JCM 8861 / NBRC 102185 / NCIMB 2190 / MS3) TaxID=547559 RepID=L9UHR3_NATMM|nr:methyl-accepting chemotaxis sensory transducer [Natrialba magadii ATCC 43099]